MASIPHAASAWADKGRCGSVVCSRFQWHTSSVPQEGGAHTGSTWAADGSQTERRSRNGVDEFHTSALWTAWRRLRSRAVHHVAPPPIRMSHLLGEPCAGSLPASVRAITASRTISHASTARSAGSSLSEACDSSLKGSFEISSAMGPTPCHLCCSST